MDGVEQQLERVEGLSPELGSETDQHDAAVIETDFGRRDVSQAPVEKRCSDRVLLGLG